MKIQQRKPSKIGFLLFFSKKVILAFTPIAAMETRIKNLLRNVKGEKTVIGICTKEHKVVMAQATRKSIINGGTNAKLCFFRFVEI